MYIFELIAKIIKNKNNPPEQTHVIETDNEELCEHVFLPIDSTGETLACTKCGFIVKNDSSKYKPKNPFN